MKAIKRFIGRRAFAAIVGAGAICAGLDWLPILPEGWILDELMWSGYVIFSGWMNRLGVWALKEG